ncbi:MAG: hypothetical protein FFODKBPE_00598 [Candidatus Argoarchaeum ethanivorans]|uniref:Uncharacterized protein n=1 Tax=Candidatus Argoarchaeum ethanivorans TaxID=2608793 RepID=A0A811T9H0_9EURY|nr:MAG: hypothetical protein FFODKBPE_00598 [Candidatus Argoarchaeum ethanivorans]
MIEIDYPLNYPLNYETKFKDTEIGLIPVDWDVEELHEEVYVNMG